MPISNVGGIGALLSGYKRYQKAFEYFGLKFSAPDKDHFGKYPRKLVERYFSVNLWNEDASDENTLKVPDIVMFVKTKFYNMQPGLVDKSVIADKLSNTLPESFGNRFIGPVIAPKTLAKQKAITAITNITNTVADLLAI